MCSKKLSQKTGASNGSSPVKTSASFYYINRDFPSVSHMPNVEMIGGLEIVLFIEKNLYEKRG